MKTLIVNRIKQLAPDISQEMKDLFLQYLINGAINSENPESYIDSFLTCEPSKEGRLEVRKMLMTHAYIQNKREYELEQEITAGGSQKVQG